jgi:hypothetical protein
VGDGVTASVPTTFTVTIAATMMAVVAAWILVIIIIPIVKAQARSIPTKGVSVISIIGIIVTAIVIGITVISIIIGIRTIRVIVWIHHT